MMPFPDLELVKTRIDDLHRRADRERLVNQALASRSSRSRWRATLSFTRSIWRRSPRARSRLDASNDQIQPERLPLLKVAAERQVDRAEGVREPVCR
jgi:hypothetical protein